MNPAGQRGGRVLASGSGWHVRVCMACTMDGLRAPACAGCVGWVPNRPRSEGVVDIEGQNTPRRGVGVTSVRLTALAAAGPHAWRGAARGRRMRVVAVCRTRMPQPLLEDLVARGGGPWSVPSASSGYIHSFYLNTRVSQKSQNFIPGAALKSKG